MLDKDIPTAAMYHTDKHVNKMLTETAQLLSNAYHFTQDYKSAPYGLGYENHPCSIWARYSQENWHWLLALGMALYLEYRHRYGENKMHVAGERIVQMFMHPVVLPYNGLTDHPQCMPEQYWSDDVVESYRAYYKGEKSHLFKWTGRAVPPWI